MVQMGLNRSLGEHQLVRHLAVAEPAGDEDDDFLLTPRERSWRRLRRQLDGRTAAQAEHAIGQNRPERAAQVEAAHAAPLDLMLDGVVHTLADENLIV